MSKKYNDDADGKITFQLTQNVSSVSFKHKIKIIVILSIILIIIVSLTTRISISAKKSNEYDKNSDNNVSIIQNIITTSLKTETLIIESTKAETMSTTIENEVSDDIVEIIPVKTINDFSESILSISSNTQLSDENIGNEIHNYSVLNIIDNDYSHVGAKEAAIMK